MSAGLPPDAIAWEGVAAGYVAYWLPRFRPFLEEAADALTPGPGPVWVPGCGPGLEALHLARRFPDRRVVASDPAPAMLKHLRAALARPDAPAGLEVVCAAADDAAPLGGPAGGLLSTFALQLLVRRDETLRAWGRALHPEGQAAVLFWPLQPPASAWARLGEAMQAVTGEPRRDWETPLRERLPALGLRLEEARDVVHPIAHASPEEAFERLVDACSLQGLLLRHGPAAVAAVGERWRAESGLEAVGGSWVHRPVARLWRLRRA